MIAPTTTPRPLSRFRNPRDRHIPVTQLSHNFYARAAAGSTETRAGWRNEMMPPIHHAALARRGCGDRSSTLCRRCPVSVWLYGGSTKAMVSFGSPTFPAVPCRQHRRRRRQRISIHRQNRGPFTHAQRRDIFLQTPASAPWSQLHRHRPFAAARQTFQPHRPRSPAKQSSTTPPALGGKAILQVVKQRLLHPVGNRPRHIARRRRPAPPSLEIARQ